MTQGYIQNLLGADVVFQSRCKVQMLDVADNVLVEQSVVHHTARATYARQVLNNPDGMARIAAQYLARSTNVSAGGIDMTDQGPLALIDDAGLLSQITSSWNVLAGIDEGSAPTP
jgi:hypothetical protein